MQFEITEQDVENLESQLEPKGEGMAFSSGMASASKTETQKLINIGNVYKTARPVLKFIHDKLLFFSKKAKAAVGFLIQTLDMIYPESVPQG